MSEAEKEILSDAIRTAINAERKRIMWRNISGVLLLAIIYLLILLIGA